MPSTDRRRLIISAIIGVLLVSGYAGLLIYYQAESSSRGSTVTVGDATAPTRLDVSARLLSVDPQTGQASVRLAFTPTGDLSAQDGSLATGIRLFVNVASGAPERSFEKGKNIAPFDAALDLTDGSITSYPFDRYTTDLYILATRAGSDAAGTPVDVPIVIEFDGTLHGLSVDGTELKSAEDGGVSALGIEISRSPTTLAVAIFVGILLLLVAVTVLVLTLAIAVFGRKLEPPIIALQGALLFGFVAFRNAQPGAPPVGALSDYLSFFWAEGIVAACLFVLVLIYFRRMAR